MFIHDDDEDGDERSRLASTPVHEHFAIGSVRRCSI
jgi:hypothetical protein